MTNQIDSTSPFGNNIGQKTPNIPTKEFPIRTMKDDLLSLQNGTVPAASSSAPFENISEEKPFNTEQSTQQEQANPASSFSQTTSPFINESLPQERPSIVTQKTPPPDEIYYSEKTSRPVDVVYKVVLVLVVLLIVAIVGLGGYYFLVVKKQPQETLVVAETELSNEEIVPTKELSEKEIPEVVASSEKKAAYLPLDITSLSTEEIKASLVSAVNKMGSADPEVFQEFTVVDLNNNPVSFPVFAQATKINLPVVVLNDLSQNFSLFIYKNKEISRLALVIAAKENNTLLEKMLSQEKTLSEDLTFLFLESKPVLTNNSFKSSAYKDASVRYLNFSSPSSTSIDYSVFKNTLIIGTNQESLRLAIDNISLNSSGPEDSNASAN